MNYLQLSFIIPSNENYFSEILMSELADIGCDTFEETETGLVAYIPENLYDEQAIASIDLLSENKNGIKWEKKFIPYQNWNKEWEENFQPVTVADKILIRAEFHPADESFPYEIIIQPEMSFGTGHHGTTSGVMELMLNYDFKNKTVCDMGCGTGILAVLAEKLGAVKIDAVDNDEHCVDNSQTNIQRNNCKNIQAFLGDASYLSNKAFDVIIANINRNVLIENMHYFSQSVTSNGLLFLSGFYEEDFLAIEKSTSQNGFIFKEKLLKNNWCAAIFHRAL